MDGVGTDILIIHVLSALVSLPFGESMELWITSPIYKARSFIQVLWTNALDPAKIWAMIWLSSQQFQCVVDRSSQNQGLLASISKNCNCKVGV